MSVTLEKDLQILDDSFTGVKDGENQTICWVTCVMRPEKLDAVKDALNKLNLVGGMTVTAVRGFGRQKGQTIHYRGEPYVIRFIDKIRLDMVVPREDADKVIQIIRSQACTGTVGDGKIFVFNVAGVMRIRTGERGRNAL